MIKVINPATLQLFAFAPRAMGAPFCKLLILVTHIYCRLWVSAIFYSLLLRFCITVRMVQTRIRHVGAVWRCLNFSFCLSFSFLQLHRCTMGFSFRLLSAWGWGEFVWNQTTRIMWSILSCRGVLPGNCWYYSSVMEGIIGWITLTPGMSHS